MEQRDMQFFERKVLNEFKSEQYAIFRSQSKGLVNIRHLLQAYQEMGVYSQLRKYDPIKEIKGYSGIIQAIKSVMVKYTPNEMFPQEVAFKLIALELFPVSFPKPNDEKGIDLMFDVFKNPREQVSTRSPIYNSEGEKRQMMQKIMKGADQNERDFNEHHFKEAMKIPLVQSKVYGFKR